MGEEEFCYCHHDDTDEYHDCLDYVECEECPYYYADDHENWSCDIEEPCINGNMFEPKEEEKFNEIET